MHAPQWTYAALTLAGLMLSAHDHGKPRRNENVWASIVASVLTLSILFWGGFFSH